jgi:hypothetical protein
MDFKLRSTLRNTLSDNAGECEADGGGKNKEDKVAK